MTVIKAAMATAALILLSVGDARADLLSAGGFQTDNFFIRWTVEAGLTAVQPDDASGDVSQSGNISSGVGDLGAFDTLSQTAFADTAGQVLQISLRLGSNGAAPYEFRADLNGVTLFDQVIAPTQPYIDLSFNMIATGMDALTLLIGDALIESDDPIEGSGPIVPANDSVSVGPAPVDTPEPATVTLIGAGLLGLTFARRGRS